MSQHDFDIANQTASATRADLNNALAALATQSSGVAEPTTTYANMIWYETDSNWLWQRNEADSAWVRLLYVDQSGSLSLLDNTKVVNAAGVQQGLLGDQATGTWETGTSTTESLVSPAKIKAAVAAAGAETNLETTVISTAVSSVDFTFDESLYHEVRFVLHGVRVATDATNLLMRTSANDGSSYDSGVSDYEWSCTGGRANSPTSALGAGDDSASGMQLGLFQLGNEADSALSGNFTVYAPSDTTETRVTGMAAFRFSTAEPLTTNSMGGTRNSSAIVNGVRFFASSGNLTSGTIRMIGVLK